MSNNRNRIVFPAEFGRLQPQLAPAVQGGEPTYTLYLVYQDGTVYPLADDDVLEIVYQDTSDDEVYSTTTGLSVADAEAGIVTWEAAAALGLAGSFWLQLKVNDETSLRVKWKVEAALDASGAVPPVAMTSLTAAQVALVQALATLTGLANFNGAGGAAAIKLNLSATAAPTSGDDTGDGYTVGSLWADTTNDKAYICLDATLSAAVWAEITGVAHAALSTTAHGGILPEDAGIVAVSGARDLATTDGGKIVEASGTFALNCPNGLDAGFQCAIAPISGTVTLTATTTLQYWSGGTLVAASGAVTLNGMVSVYHAGSNVWRVAGDVSE